MIQKKIKPTHHLMFLNLLTGNTKNSISIYEEPCKSFYTLFLEVNSF